MGFYKDHYDVVIIGRREMDKQLGWFHPCSAWPLSDLKIKIPIL